MLLGHIVRHGKTQSETDALDLGHALIRGMNPEEGLKHQLLVFLGYAAIGLEIHVILHIDPEISLIHMREDIDGAVL
ncbi:MAG: hypothetical protein BWY82_02797 [Verrucomicrobia bacterium ADurb.Bin474]|nr:MAG: hypothetical protein BWY82_02797 [Verrucomicrobia bacterium ADurb.Bin474]